MRTIASEITIRSWSTAESPDVVLQYAMDSVSVELMRLSISYPFR